MRCKASFQWVIAHRLVFLPLLTPDSRSITRLKSSCKLTPDLAKGVAKSCRGKCVDMPPFKAKGAHFGVGIMQPEPNPKFIAATPHSKSDLGMSELKLFESARVVHLLQCSDGLGSSVG